jgi:hypothetical protein
MPAMAPKIQSFGTVGHEGSTLQTGACASACAAHSTNIEQTVNVRHMFPPPASIVIHWP